MRRVIVLALVCVVGWVHLAEPASAQAVAVRPTYGSAVVDGSVSDWNLNTDAKIALYNAGKPANAVEAYAYLRYDYTHSIMSVLVLQTGYPTSSPYLLNSVFQAGNSWAYLGSASNKVYSDASAASYPPNGTLPDLAWLPTAQPTTNHSVGYEAAFALAHPAGPSYQTQKFVVHTDWDSTPGGAPTGGTAGSLGFANGAASWNVLDLSPPTSTPEPVSAAIILLGGLLFVGTAWRRRRRAGRDA